MHHQRRQFTLGTLGLGAQLLAAHSLTAQSLAAQSLAAPARAPAFVPHARTADLPRFTLGVASGQPAPHSLVLWTRLMGDDLPPAVPVHWQLAHDEAFAQVVARGSSLAQLADAHSVHVTAQGLAPGRGYFYRFGALGQHSPVGRTRTAPAPDAAATLHAALASCQRYEHAHYAAWRHVAHHPPDLVLFAGDYIYEYASARGGVRQHALPPARSLADYRARYALYKSDPALQAAHAACPWLVVWDDHEVDNDYANDQGLNSRGEAFLRRRAAAYKAWWEHQPVPMAWRPDGPQMRIHQRLDWGRLARLHALDTRQHRDHQACPRLWRGWGANEVTAQHCAELQQPGRSLLGAAQEQWLADGWSQAHGWNLLLQTTLMARLSRSPVAGPGTGRYYVDTWDGYPHARQRLLQQLATRQVPNPVVLGGDVHTHYVADLKLDVERDDGPVVASEFCATSIASNGPAPGRVERLLCMNPHLHHGRGDQRGYIALRLDARELRADLMAVDQPQRPDSPLSVQAAFVVQAGRPGPQRA